VGTRTLVVGLDAATWTVIEHLEEHLKTLIALRQKGAYGALCSVPNLNSAPAWTTITTGVNPGKHGVYWFAQPIGNVYRHQYINASFRRARPIWDLLSQAGRRVCIVNVPLTYPADKVNGLFVSGWDAPSRKDKRYAYPPGLVDELQMIAGGDYPVTSGISSFIRAGKIEEGITRSHQVLATRCAVARHLLEKEDWDFFMIVFVELDAAQHWFWKYMQPDAFTVPEADRNRYGNVIQGYYEHLDCILGDLVTLAGNGAHVFVLSDHGAGPSNERNHLLPILLEHWGLLHRQRGGKRLVSRMIRTGIRFGYGQLDRRLSRDAKLTLSRRLPWLRRSLENEMNLGGISWARTKAYANGKRPEVTINLEGRQPEGCVPASQYRVFCQKVIERLLACQVADCGHPLFDAVYHRSEVYHGPYVGDSPDIIVQWHPGPVPSRIDIGGEIIEWDARLDEPNIQLSGDHVPEGILLMHGPDIVQGTVLHTAHLTDIVPTVLYLLDEPVPYGLDGRVLAEAIRTERFQARPPRCETTFTAPPRWYRHPSRLHRGRGPSHRRASARTGVSVGSRRLCVDRLSQNLQGLLGHISVWRWLVALMWIIALISCAAWKGISAYSRWAQSQHCISGSHEQASVIETILWPGESTQSLTPLP
jgi:predicted AlkP superfamily phosphohydrolase/phosphomutase